MKPMPIILLLSFLASQGLYAQLQIPDASSYESGHKLCQVTNKEILQREVGTYIPVPVDYKDPSKGLTDIYAHFYGTYNPQWPTLIYFNGGPGQPSHWGLFHAAVQFNMLLMDQRGIGCSRPTKLEQYLDPSFYSSENVARDAEQVRKFLKIDKLTVYGISYGTVPATIFAHLFPDSTRALILEGTVFSGDKRLWEAPHRRKILQKMIDTLPVEIRNRMDAVTREPGIPVTWFSDMARNDLMSNGGLEKLKRALLTLSDEASYQHLLQQLRQSYAPITYVPHPLFIMNDIPYAMISCQEMEMGHSEIVLADALQEGARLVPVIDLEAQRRCQALPAHETRTYQALQYPFKVPVTYFQGGDDSATAAPEAIYHYKQVPRGFKQLLIMKKGGHNPNLELMDMQPEQVEIFGKAFYGQRIPPELISKFNQASDLSWVTTR